MQGGATMNPAGADRHRLPKLTGMSTESEKQRTNRGLGRFVRSVIRPGSGLVIILVKFDG
jgi:hypothetical protein